MLVGGRRPLKLVASWPQVFRAASLQPNIIEYSNNIALVTQYSMHRLHNAPERTPARATVSMASGNWRNIGWVDVILHTRSATGSRN